MSTSKQPHVESTETETLQTLAQKVEALEERVERVEEEKADLRERAERAEKERDDLRDRVREQEDTTTRTAAMFAKLVNEVREYDTDEGEGVTPDDPDLPKEAGNVAEQLHDTITFCRENNELLKIRERDHDQQEGRMRSKVRKQLDVLNYAKKHAKAAETSLWRMDYKQVAAEYGCHKNDAYRVMDDMAREIPGVSVKDARTMSWDVQGVGGKFLQVELKHPDIHGWIRAREN